MNVLVLSPGADTGGQGFRIKQAFDRHGGDCSVRAMRASTNYIQYPYDLVYSEDVAKALYRWADVVHHKTRLDLYPVLDCGQGKPTVMHHQGTRLRNNYEVVIQEDQSVGAVPLVSTVDLLEGYPTAQWLPAPFDMDFLAKYRQIRERAEIRICHAPTNRRVKSTELILKAVDRLSRKHRIVFDLVEGVEWKVALSRKGRSNIFIDQLVLGYGNNAVEAWGMGLPVIAGVESPWVRDKMIELWGELPFYEANEQNFEQRLEELVQSPELREEYGQRGLAHVMRFHEESQVVKFLKKVWSEAPPSLGAGKFKSAMVR